MNTEFEKQVGEKIRYYRLKQNFSQEILSAKLQLKNCDITRSALAKIEVGQRHLYIDELRALKEILNISFEDLLY